MHLKYGPVYRYSPNGLSFNTSTAHQSIHSTRANCQKSSFYETFPVKRGAWSVASATDKQIHSRKRRILGHGLSTKAIREMEQCVLPHIRKFCKVLGDSMSSSSNKESSTGCNEDADNLQLGVVNVANKATYLTWDIMADFVFSNDLNTQYDATHRSLKPLMEARMKTIVIYGRLPFLKTTRLLHLLAPKLASNVGAFQKYATNCMMTRLASESPTVDTVHYVKDAKDPLTHTTFDARELLSESAGLIVAGSDTTGTCLSSTLYYLSRPSNTHILARLRRELTLNFDLRDGEVNDIEKIVAGTNLSNCYYLRAIIDEALRLAPPVPGALPRKVLQGGLDVDGLHISAGIDIATPIYALHHNEQNYPDAWSFRPERWLSEGLNAEQVRIQVDAFAAFGLGPRGCLGKNMAYMELGLTIARVAWSFDFETAVGSDELCSGWNEEYVLEDSFTALKDGPLLKFSSR